jgi:hypothetical protein
MSKYRWRIEAMLSLVRWRLPARRGLASYIDVRSAFVLAPQPSQVSRPNHIPECNDALRRSSVTFVSKQESDGFIRREAAGEEIIGNFIHSHTS